MHKTSVHRSLNDTTLLTILNNHIAQTSLMTCLSNRECQYAERHSGRTHCLSMPTFVYNCGLNVVFVGEGAGEPLW